MGAGRGRIACVRYTTRIAAVSESEGLRKAEETMAQETEIKLRIDNTKAFQRALKRLGVRAGAPGGRVHELNVIYDTPEGGLAKQGQLLRIRTETSEKEWKKRGAVKNRVLVTFKRPVEEGTDAPPNRPPRGRYKVREEIELEVAEAGKMTKIFEGLGMKGWFMYEKYRTTFALPEPDAAPGIVALDETPIGVFMELEGPEYWIDRTALHLGFSPNDYVTVSYATLYRDYVASYGGFPDMIFKAES